MCALFSVEISLAVGRRGSGSVCGSCQLEKGHARLDARARASRIRTVTRFCLRLLSGTRSWYWWVRIRTCGRWNLRIQARVLESLVRDECAPCVALLPGRDLERSRRPERPPGSRRRSLGRRVPQRARATGRMRHSNDKMRARRQKTPITKRWPILPLASRGGGGRRCGGGFVSAFFPPRDDQRPIRARDYVLLHRSHPSEPSRRTFAAHTKEAEPGRASSGESDGVLEVGATTPHVLGNT